MRAKLSLLLILCLLMAIPVNAQGTAYRLNGGVSGNRPVNCQSVLPDVFVDTDTGHLRICINSAWVDFGTGGGGSGANTALSNLAAVSINTSLLAQTGVDIGSTVKPFRDVYLSDTLRFTADATGNVSYQIGRVSAVGVMVFSGGPSGYWFVKNNFTGYIAALDDTGAWRVSSGGLYGFTSAALVNSSAIDTAIGRVSGGVMEVNTGTPGTPGTNAALLFGENVAPKTTNYTVLAANKNTFFSNTGAAGEVDFTLPTAAAGLTYVFYVDAAQTVKVIASGSATIRIGTSVSAANGNATNAATGSIVRLTAISTTQWVAEFVQGTWTVT